MSLSSYIAWLLPSLFSFFFFNDTATTEIYTLSLHDALPISVRDRMIGPLEAHSQLAARREHPGVRSRAASCEDRKSTRLNSSHVRISYAVFCLKKKNKMLKNAPVTYIPTYNAIIP